MYDLAVSMIYPQYKTIICALDYLRLSEVVTHRTPEQRKLFVDFLDATYESICSMESADVHANLNKFCPWCDFKGFCTEYKNLVEDPTLVLPPIGELSDEELVASWDRIASAKRIVDARQREFKSEAYTRMRSANTIRGGDKELYKTQTSRVSYDPQTVFKVVGQENYVKMSSVNKSAVDKYLLDNPEAAPEIERTAYSSFNAPSIKTRKVKDKSGK